MTRRGCQAIRSHWGYRAFILVELRWADVRVRRPRGPTSTQVATATSRSLMVSLSVSVAWILIELAASSDSFFVSFAFLVERFLQQSDA